MNAPVTSATLLASRLLERHSAEQITLAVETMLAVLDYLDGDPEAEETGAEDSFQSHDGDGPGCPIGEGTRGDTAWIEWTTRGRHKLARGLSEPMARTDDGFLAQEDDEDDDPREHDDPREEDDECGQCDEDGKNTVAPGCTDDGKDGPGCPIADPAEWKHLPAVMR